MNKPLCPAPWKTPVVNWDGKITVCCRDINFELSPGSIENESFNELWFGEKMSDIRKKHLTGKKDLLPVCCTCPGVEFPIITTEELVEFKKIFDLL